MNQLGNRLSNLLSVKSLVTLILTIAWVVMLCRGQDVPQVFLTLYTVVISFYFGTQSQKLQDVLTGAAEAIEATSEVSVLADEANDTDEEA